MAGQVDEEIRAGPASPGEDEERVVVERFGQEVVGGGHVLARVGPVGAGQISTS